MAAQTFDPVSYVYHIMRIILIFSILCIVVLGTSNCSKSDQFQTKGIILGVDARKCACFDNQNCGCCGFWVLQIEDKSYIFKKLPDSPKLDLNSAKFPINVSLDFHPDPDSCAQAWGYIIIDRFRIDS